MGVPPMAVGDDPFPSLNSGKSSTTKTTKPSKEVSPWMIRPSGASWRNSSSAPKASV